MNRFTVISFTFIRINVDFSRLNYFSTVSNVSIKKTWLLKSCNLNLKGCYDVQDSTEWDHGDSVGKKRATGNAGNGKTLLESLKTKRRALTFWLRCSERCHTLSAVGLWASMLMAIIWMLGTDSCHRFNIFSDLWVPLLQSQTGYNGWSTLVQPCTNLLWLTSGITLMRPELS